MYQNPRSSYPNQLGTSRRRIKPKRKPAHHPYPDGFSPDAEEPQSTTQAAAQIYSTLLEEPAVDLNGLVVHSGFQGDFEEEEKGFGSRVRNIFSNNEEELFEEEEQDVFSDDDPEYEEFWSEWDVDENGKAFDSDFLAELDDFAAGVLQSFGADTQSDDDSNKRERGAAIYYDESSGFYLGGESVGTKNSVDVAMSGYPVAWLHTHTPTRNKSAVNSENRDLWDKDRSYTRKIRRKLPYRFYAYLGTPYGTVVRFNPPRYTYRSAELIVSEPGFIDYFGE